MKTHGTLLITLMAYGLLTAIPCTAAPGKASMANPDLTKGDPIPKGSTHDWTLGATGARGWMFSDKLETSDARQILVTTVDKGSPSDGLLEVGDVILGVAGKPFSYDPRTEFGKALTAAESEAGGGNLSLIRWKNGEQQEVTVKLPVLGTYSATAPFDCPKSKLILERGCEALAKRMDEPGYTKQSAITRSLNALALLASGKREYRRLIKKEAEWASNFSAESMATWYYGYVISFLAEYIMATGDKSPVPDLRRLALEAANGQSIVGSWGHKFAGEDGRLVGYGMMNAPGVPLTTSLVLAREAGVSDPEVSMAIDRSIKLLHFYVGKGSIPYGDHAPWIQTHDDNGKNGMAAVLFNLLREKEAAEYFSRMSLACHGNERDTGHTGNFWNIAWAVPGVVQSGPYAIGAWMEEFGAWYFDYARRWDGTFPHQGPPHMTGDSTKNWDATGAFLLAYAMPLKQIMLTGRRPSVASQLDPAGAKYIVISGRGWTNKHRNKAYDSLGGEQLFECLSSWSPVVRDRAAMALARRKDSPPQIGALIDLLDSPDPNAQYGACKLISMLGSAASPAVPALRKCLKETDVWLRIKAAEALANIGKPAMSALPEMLGMISAGPSASDPRGMEQRYLTAAVFGGMLKKDPIDGVDRELLLQAVRAGLKNEDGRARGVIGGMYGKLDSDEIKPLLPAILEAAIIPAPSGIMFADQVRIAGLQVLAAHHVEEAMQACAEYILKQNPWGSQKRTPEILSILLTYGAHANEVIPTLKLALVTFQGGEKNFPKKLSEQKAKDIKDAIEKIQASRHRPQLMQIGR